MPPAVAGRNICLLCRSRQLLQFRHFPLIKQHHVAYTTHNQPARKNLHTSEPRARAVSARSKNPSKKKSQSNITTPNDQVQIEATRTRNNADNAVDYRSFGSYDGPKRSRWKPSGRRENRKPFAGHAGASSRPRAAPLSHVRLPRRGIDKRPIEAVVDLCLERMRSLLDHRAFQLETGLLGDDRHVQFKWFIESIRAVLFRSSGSSHNIEVKSKIREALLAAYEQGDEAGLFSQLKYLLAAKTANLRLSPADKENQMKLADLRYPIEWYPEARRAKRTIHLHIGPTNSGKTYHALKRLEEAETGCYAGPLRLLAHEVYTRLNAKGKKCDLVTGDEIITNDEDKAALSSCTVEMVPIGEDLDVAVIDEIQMIGDHSRGWAWTQAVLGLRAKELHLCGESRTEPLIRQLAASMGEKLIVHNYERLSPLQVASKGLGGKLENLQKGDCVVSFSTRILHGLKKEIQEKSGKEVAIVYGALPPEIRAQQADLFNNQDNNYDILVASDAIGMGLNLSIKRIVFETMQRYNGTELIPVDIASVKQIGGRAGRYRTASQDNSSAQVAHAQTTAENPIMQFIPPKPPSENIGFITTLHDSHLPFLRKAMRSEPPPILAAGLKVPDNLIIRFSSYFPSGTPFSYILLRLNEISRMHPRYTLCNLQDQISIADAVQQVEGLSISERLMFCYAPANMRNPILRSVTVAMARCVANRANGGLLEIPDIDLEILDEPFPEPGHVEAYIMQLATAHQAVVLYLWLSYRENTIFHSQALAFHTKGLLQEKLDTALASVNRDKEWLQNRMRAFDASRRRQNDAAADAGIAEETSSMRVDDDGDPGLVEELADGFKEERKILDFIPSEPQPRDGASPGA